MEPKKTPGVSGKNEKGDNWINSQEYQQQKDFVDKLYDYEEGFAAQGRGQNLHGRSDLENQGTAAPNNVTEQQILEALKRSPHSDISDICVEFIDGEAHFYGRAEDNKEVREIENIALNITGVRKVISHLILRDDESSPGDDYVIQPS